MQNHGVPQADQEPAVFSYGWPRAEAAEDAFIGSHGRSFDLIVLGRPGPDRKIPECRRWKPRCSTAAGPSWLSRRPRRKLLARNVLVAWNRSTQQARTNAFALPLLRLAEKVTVLTVEGGTVAGPSGDDAARHLRRNGDQSDGVDGQAPGRARLERSFSITRRRSAATCW